LKRREFITLLGGATAAWPLAVRAQQHERMRRIGVLMAFAERDSEAPPRVTAFRRGLQELGWTAGGNVRIDYRWSAGDPDRTRANAKELVRLKPDVILVNYGHGLAALQNDTRTVPIVFVNVPDPVDLGFVSSLASPGGNTTGFTNLEHALAGKWLEVLKEIAPDVIQVGIIYNPEDPTWPERLHQIEAVASSLGVQVTPAGVHDGAEIERAIGAFARESNGGLIVLPNPIVSADRELIVALANRHRLPAVYANRNFVKNGGLMSYGVDLADLYRRAAGYVDRILKGEKPGDLPIQTPTKFRLVINLKTAKALHLTVPTALRARADEVIE
jgi:putative ABC transport system substrate-binding protein